MIYYVLKMLSCPKSESESALIAFVLRSLQAHVSILINTQLHSKTAQIVPQKLLKLLLKLTERLDFSQSQLIKSRGSIFPKAQADLIQDLYKLVLTHSDIPIEKTIASKLGSIEETSQ